jgi:ATP phosphoribosyltransferase
VLLPKPFVAAPIDHKHYYCYSPLWHYGKAEAIRLVAGGLDRAIPVYALFVPSEHLDQDIERLPQIQGYTWKRSDRSGTTAVIMILTKETVASSLGSIRAGGMTAQ